MTTKSRLLFFSFFIIANSVFAVDFNVKMSQYCRYQNGNFQARSEDLTVDLIPVNTTSAAKLDKLATQAAQEGKDVSFQISGSVVSDKTYPGPHGSQPGVRVLEILTNNVN